MKIHNFSAGPGILPPPVLLQIQTDLLNISSTQISILETSHRSKTFSKIITQASQDITSLLEIPDDYVVLYVQGGASTQFASILQTLQPSSIDYFVSGGWFGIVDFRSLKAFQESVKLGFNAKCINYANNAEGINNALYIKSNAEYLYYCDNETVDGIELPVDFPSRINPEINATNSDNNGTESTPNSNQNPTKPILICDMSSNFMSRKFDITQ
jgi:phosphoserine aminotransferase